MSRPKNAKSVGRTSTSPIPPLLFPSKSSSHRAWMLSLKKRGLIYKIGPRLYTSVPKNKVNDLVKGQWSEIVSQLYPKSLLSHRSALEYRPTENNEIFLTGTTNKKIRYPGLTLHFLRGPAALKDDLNFLNFKASSLSRALLENFSTQDSKVLSRESIETRLEQILQTKGSSELNEIRTQAKEISRKLKWPRQFKKLDQMIGALLGTKDIKVLKSSSALARAVNMPYDQSCVEKLEILFAELRHFPFLEIKEKNRSTEHLKNKTFFESYFSNYIEGTTFEISEAEEIIFDGKIYEKRPLDAHDILGTYQIISDPNEMRLTPTHFENFEKLLKTRHFILMKNRTEALPGHFKEKPNRVGNTHFVQPNYVRGSLKKGLDFYNNLPSGIARAIYMMFLVAEIHPFADGNGRIARIMMNAELFSQNLSTIIIPNVYREDYLLSLRALSRQLRPLPFIKMLSEAQKFSNLDFSQYQKILKYLQSHNWFEEPNEARLIKEQPST